MTPKQEAFALAYVETGNASEAYRRAYNAENMKPAVINVKASQLLHSDKVAVRVADLRQKNAQAVEEKAGITAAMVAERAWEIATAKDNGPAVMALNLLAKQFPEFSEKHEFSGDVTMRVQALHAVAQMSAEQLKALAEGAR